MSLLNAEEEAELHARPIGAREWRNLTEEQIVRRIGILKKMHASIESDMLPWQRDLYAKMPVWGFYVDAHSEDAWLPRRVYGVCLGEGDEERVHNVTLLIMMNNNTLGGTPVTQLRRVERWSAEHIERMRCGMYTDIGLFEDPLGIMCFSK
jgi:hypothetical protein